MTPEEHSAKALDKLKAALTEATLDVAGSLSGLSLQQWYDEAGDGFTQQGGMRPVGALYQQNRKRGEVIPAYTTEQDLQIIRDRMRILAYYNEFVICAVRNRVHYAVGQGFTYKVTPADRGDASGVELAARCQDFVELFREVNDLAGVEQDACRRMDEEGEFFLRLFQDGRGMTHVRAVEPEHVKAPNGESWSPAYSFGKETDPQDVESIRAYWIVENPGANWNPNRVDESEIVHVTANVKRNAKRGLPTFFPVEANLRRCEDLLASMTSMAKARAKIALIRKLTNVTNAAATELLRNLTALKVTDPTTQQDANIEKLRYGTVLTASGNTEYEFPNSDIGANDYVEVLQAELRTVAGIVQFPEWMLTALADAKYSNAFVVESPVLRAFQSLQQKLTDAFGNRRVGHRRSLMWRAIKYAVDCGVLDAETLYRCKLTCDGPSLETRDKSAEAATNKTYFDMGVKSAQTIQQEQGLDAETEAANFAAAQPAQPEQPVDDVTLQERKDASGHEHGRDGKFSAKGGGSDATPKPPKTRIQKVARRASAVKRYVDGRLSRSQTGPVYRRAKHAVHRIERAMSVIMKRTQVVAAQAARERGLPDDHVARVGRHLATLDFMASFALGKGATIASGGNAVAGFAAGMLPSASVAYIAYSTARDPRATLRAARKFVSGELSIREQMTLTESVSGSDDAGALLEYFNAAADPEWADAVLSVALDTHHDLGKALAVARRVLADQPTQPAEDSGNMKVTETTDASGHEHADDGKFTGSGGGGAAHEAVLSITKHITAEALHDPAEFRRKWSDMSDADKKAATKELAVRGLLPPVDARKKKPLTASEVIASVRGQYEQAKFAHTADPLNRHVPFMDSDAFRVMAAGH